MGRATRVEFPLFILHCRFVRTQVIVDVIAGLVFTATIGGVSFCWKRLVPGSTEMTEDGNGALPLCKMCGRHIAAQEAGEGEELTLFGRIQPNEMVEHRTRKHGNILSLSEQRPSARTTGNVDDGGSDNNQDVDGRISNRKKSLQFRSRAIMVLNTAREANVPAELPKHSLMPLPSPVRRTAPRELSQDSQQALCALQDNDPRLSEGRLARVSFTRGI